MMAAPLRLLVLVLAVASACLGAAVAHQPGSGEGYTIAGRVKIDAASAKGFGLPTKTSNTKVILNGGQRVTFARPDGYFAFHNVPAGTHLIEVSSIGYFFSPVRVDISARNPGAGISPGGTAMDMDAFERLTAETRLHDALIGLEEADGSDEEEERAAAAAAAELQCPFCGEEFDGVGLCCHIDDEHPAETRAGVCPFCTDRVGMDLVGHIISQHPSFFKGRWRNRRFSSGSHSSTLAILKKDVRNLQSCYGGSSRAASLNTVPDPLLSSFVGNFIEVDLAKDAQQEFLDETNEKSDSSEQKAAESADEPLLPEVKEERTRRSQFVQGLVLSLMFDDIL